MVSYYEMVENSHIVAGLILNSLFVLAIIRFSRDSLGSYKTLLLMFASYDLFLVILHAVLKPRVVVVCSTIIGVAADYYNSRFITAFYASCNTVPFVLMIIDFFYRFLCIRYHELIVIFSNKKFITVLFCAVIMQFVGWFTVLMVLLTGEGPDVGKALLREESGRRLGHEIEEGWLVMNYWEGGVMNVPVTIAMIYFSIIMVGSLTVAIVLASLTYYHCYVVYSHSISPQSLSLQRTLFVSLCAQTAVPLFFVYIPYILVIDMPFFGIPVFFWDDACMLLTSCFPAWDALIAIVLMGDYRQGLIGLVWRKKKDAVGFKSAFTVSSVLTASAVHDSPAVSVI